MTASPAKLRLGYDAKRAVANTTGLGNYSRYAIGVMAALYPHNDYVLYAPRRRDNPRLDTLLTLGNVDLRTPSTFVGRHAGAWWRSVALPACLRNDAIDIYHGLSNELPLTVAAAGIPTVVTIHDLIWRRVPHDYTAIDRRLYELKYSRSARAATRIIAISECTRRDIINDWGIDEAKIDVIYQGIDPMFHRRPTADDRRRVIDRYRLPDRYIIAVGTLQSRKNQMLAVKAMTALPRDVQLILVGGRARGGSYADDIRRYVDSQGIADRVRMLDQVPFDDLPALYAAATAASYTSRYEGFGLPVAEALACGTPVIAATGSCLEEAGGRGAIYVDPDDVRAYAQAAAALLDSPYMRDKLVGLGQRHLRRFDDAEFGRRTMACYTKAINDFIIKSIK